MSSFVGHGIAAGMVYGATSCPWLRTRDRRLWLGWLLVVTVVPDLDYILPWLHPSAHQGLRITHALVSCQIVPLVTWLGLRWRGVGDRALAQAGLQITLVGFSHLVLDLLVGVTGLPLFWPFSDRTFRLPFGILPSAPLLRVDNYYLYLNWFIELGVLMPLAWCVGWWRYLKIRGWADWIMIFLFLSVSARFMYWAYHLSR